MFKSNTSEENVCLLDLKVKLKEIKIETGLHVKPTDRSQYLYYISLHSEL